jgi:hypothetical protein
VTAELLKIRIQITTPEGRQIISLSPSRLPTHRPPPPLSPSSSPTRRRNITLGRPNRMITGTSPTMAPPLRRTRTRPHMRRIRRRPSNLSRLPRSASMRTIWVLARMSTSLMSLKSRNRPQTHTLALSSNSSRRSRSWANAAIFMRRSPLRSTQQVVTLMCLPMTIPTPTSPRRTRPTHLPMSNQRRNKIPPAPQEELPPVPMPS